MDSCDTKLNENFTNGEKVLYDLLFDSDNTKNDKPSALEFKNEKFLVNESLSYLQELNSFHVDRLQLEPKLLLDKKDHINEEIQTLAFSNYKTFIRTAQCSREIYSDFSIIETKLDKLITQLPEFGSKCDNFTKLIQGLNTSRRSNNLTLQKHNQLLEILEISQLMDTCVRNEYYEEALDLANYVKRLEKKFSSSIGIIKNIVYDVNESLNLMLKQLLGQLKTNLQFNQCLKIIGIIRRMDVFGESELRVKFLQLRDSWLQSIISNIPTTNPFNHISKTIEEMRVHLFDIITQYKAIFSDDDSFSSNPNESKLFYCWLQQKIKCFLSILKTDLKLGVGNRIDSVLSQAMYFGLAFSRVGLDFRVLMVPLFEEAVLDQVKKCLDQAQLNFEESLNKMNWSELSLENKLYSSPFDQAYKQSFVKEDLSKKSSTINAPTSLLEFQPLAIYLNEILSCFNDLRLCAPLSIFSNVARLIRESLIQIGHSIESYYKKEKKTFDKNEINLFNHFLCHLAYIMIPFVEKCLRISFPQSQLQAVLLVPESDIEKLERIMKLDLNEIFSQSILSMLQEVKKNNEDLNDKTANSENETKETLFKDESMNKANIENKDFANENVEKCSDMNKEGLRNIDTELEKNKSIENLDDKKNQVDSMIMNNEEVSDKETILEVESSINKDKRADPEENNEVVKDKEDPL